jgi:SAM-dependent methyltransferase
VTETREVFDRLAPGYDSHFQIPHRRMYDDLAWEHVARLLPDPPGLVIDVGCGTGRWAPRLVELGHRVVGIEVSDEMAEAAKARAAELPHGAFSVLHADVADVELESGRADVVLALGSFQYTCDPAVVLERFETWLRPGGHAVVLVDSLVGLAVELLARGHTSEAVIRSTTRRGVWAPIEAPGTRTGLHLFDRAALEQLFLRAGFDYVRSAGLLVQTVSRGDARSLPSDGEAWSQRLEDERSLAQIPVLADLGKHLMVTGRRPGDPPLPGVP